MWSVCRFSTCALCSINHLHSSLTAYDWILLYFSTWLTPLAVTFLEIYGNLHRQTWINDRLQTESESDWQNRTESLHPKPACSDVHHMFFVFANRWHTTIKKNTNYLLITDQHWYLYSERSQFHNVFIAKQKLQCVSVCVRKSSLMHLTSNLYQIQHVAPHVCHGPASCDPAFCSSLSSSIILVQAELSLICPELLCCFFLSHGNHPIIIHQCCHVCT